jgi:hypothetical protein
VETKCGYAATHLALTEWQLVIKHVKKK